MTKSIRALIVDDEPVARRRLKRMLEAHPEFQVVGEANDGDAALDHVVRLQPALIFLDVEMPALDGMAAAGALARAGSPAIVFVTAHEQFAKTAFELDAVDYLLKPFDADRFAAAIARVHRRLNAAASPSPPRRDRLLALVRGAARLLRVAEVEQLVAAGNYAEVTLADGSRYLVRETISALAATLPEPFVRVSRSMIVRSDRITSVTSTGHGDAVLALQNGGSVRLSRRYRMALAGAVTGIGSRPSLG